MAHRDVLSEAMLRLYRWWFAPGRTAFDIMTALFRLMIAKLPLW